MTENNLFEEVREDLERQKLQALWNQYGIWLIVAVFGIVLSTAATTGYHTWKSGREQKLTSNLLAATESTKDRTETIDLLQKFANQNQGSEQAILALLRAGATAAEQNDTAKAIQIFDAVAADTKADSTFRQLGDLLSVQLQMDNVDPSMLSLRLQPLTNEHAPWHFSALEAQGYLALRAGNTAKAKQIFVDLSQDARTPQSIAARASDIVRSLN